MFALFWCSTLRSSQSKVSSYQSKGANVLPDREDSGTLLPDLTTCWRLKGDCSTSSGHTTTYTEAPLMVSFTSFPSFLRRPPPPSSPASLHTLIVKLHNSFVFILSFCPCSRRLSPRFPTQSISASPVFFPSADIATHCSTH